MALASALSPAAEVLARERRAHRFEHLRRQGVEIVDQPDETGRRLAEIAERLEIAVAFAKADAAVVGLDLDDRAQRPGFVDAHDVQKRWVAESDRRNADIGDPGPATGCRGRTGDRAWHGGSP